MNRETSLNINKLTYLDYLRKANDGSFLPSNRLADLDLLIVRELINEDLLSDSKERFLSTKGTNIIVLTPKGAVTLSEWEKAERDAKWWYKLGDGFIRFSWVIVGVIASALTKWLSTY